jgi:hypothetical protein
MSFRTFLFVEVPVCVFVFSTALDPGFTVTLRVFLGLTMPCVAVLSSVSFHFLLLRSRTRVLARFTFRFSFSLCVV